MNQTSPHQWARVKELFHAAIEREPADRPAYLTAACGTDDVLRAELERLLAAHMEAADFIEWPSPRLTGRHIGRYRIGELIGQGGMGHVYAARDTELGRDVALKVGRSIAEESRLRREAQHASRLNHPNICTIHEVGVVDGRRYIVMERVDGRQLSEVIPPEGLPTHEVLRYGIQIADAVAHAHKHGVIHRDLKPANIVVTPDQRVKVLDFGLSQMLPAERLKAATVAKSAVTRDGMIAGTLSYMAPELLRGEPAGQPTDIWALGVLLYEMATGARPFRGATEFELCGSILHEPPASMPPAVPLPLQRIIERCLAKHPPERCQNASEIKTTLEAIGGQQATWSLGLSRFFARGHARPRLAALLSLVLVLAAAAVTWRVWGPSRSMTIGASGRPVVAVLPFDDFTGTEDTAWLSTGVQTMLLTGLAQTPALHVVSSERLHEIVTGSGGSELKSLDRARAADAARRAGAGAAVVGSIVRVGPTFRIDAQVEDLSRGRVLAATTVSGTDLFVLIDRLAAQIRDGLGVGGSSDVRSIADVSSRSLDAYRVYSEAVDAFVNFQTDAAQRLLEQAVGIDPTFAEAYLQLALIAGPAGRPADRRGYLRKAAEHRERLSDRRRLVMEAELARDEGRFADAARRLDELVTKFPDVEAISTLALQLHMPVVGPLPDSKRLVEIQRGAVASNPTSAYARNNFAYALLYANRFDDAIRELETAARLAPRQPVPHDGLGEVYLMMGSPERAIESFSRALTIDPAFSFSRRGRAWTLAVLGRFDEALQEPISAPHVTAVMLARVGRFREASAALSAAFQSTEEGGDNVRLASLHLVSAMLALEQNRYDQALTECARAERILTSVPRDRGRFISALAALMHGVTEVRRGRLTDATVHLERQRRLYPSSPEWWQRALEGEIALAAGDLDRAAAAFSQAAPQRKQFFSGLVEGSVLSNDLHFRDGLARVAIARGDVQRAVDIYRQLLSFGPEEKWVAAFEPRYVLEIAKLLEQLGDRRGARAEYERFLQFWARADADRPQRSEAQRALNRTRLR